MWSKFCKNSILQGTVDLYCLACEFLLRSEQDALAHIEKPIHKKNIDKTAYVASSIGDHIRKVNKGYYCEDCNVYLTTMTKVQLHRADEEHIFNKADDIEKTGKPSFLKWVRNAVVAFDDLLIDETTWNGFVDDTCVVCDTEFDDRQIHKSETTHVLKLIQSKVQIGSDNSLSRKIDESAYQCLTCNEIVLANVLPNHFDTLAHKKKYLECRKLKRTFMQTNNENTDSNTGNKESAKSEKEPTKTEKGPTKSEKEPANSAPKESKIKEANTEVKPKDAKVEPKAKTEPKTKPDTKAKDVEAKTKEVKAEVNNNEVKPKVLKTESKAKEPFTKLETTETVEPLQSPQKKKEIPKAFVADINKVLGTTNYLEIEGSDVFCHLCAWKMHRDMAGIHLADEHHQTIARLQKARNEKVKKDFAFKEYKEMSNEKPKEVTTETKVLAKKEKEAKTGSKDSAKKEKEVKSESKESIKKEKKVKTEAKVVVKGDKTSEDVNVNEKNEEKTTSGNSNSEEIDPEMNKKRILDSIQIFQKNDVLINLISDKAFCKRCSLTINYVFEDIETHIKEHKESKDKKVGEKYPKYFDSSLMKVEKDEKPKKVEKEISKEPTMEIPEVSTNEEKDGYIVEEVTEIEDEKPSQEVAITKVTKKTEEKPIKPKKQKETKPEEIEDASSFANTSNITYNKDFNKAFCRICDTKIPSSLKSMKEHVNGNLHKMKSSNNQPSVADMRPPSPPYRTMKMEDFVESLVVYERMFIDDAIVNEQFAISVLSFMMMTKNELDRFRCHICEKGLDANEVDEHTKTRKHVRAMEATPVVVGLHDEFIREVRPGIFHCAFCNLVEAGWDTLQRHLAAGAHHRNKLAAAWRLGEALPAVHAHRARREHAQFALFMRMLMGNDRFF